MNESCILRTDSQKKVYRAVFQKIQSILVSILFSVNAYALEPFSVINGFTITQQELYNHDQNFTAKYMTQPEIYVLADSMVATDAKKNVLNLLAYARYIFTSCGDHPDMDTVYFKNLDVKVLSSMDGKKLSRNDTKQLVRKTRSDRNKVALYFIKEGDSDNWGYAFDENIVSKYPHNKSLINTAFVQNRPSSREILKTAYITDLNGHNPEGSMGVVTAHELYHIYCKCGHHSSEEENFMKPNPTGEDLKITKAQCQKMIDVSAGTLIEVNN